MKHYQDSLLLKLSNALTEFILVIVAVFASGLVREWISPFMKRPFGLYDLKHYFFVFLIMSVVIMILYYLVGDYHSVHYRGLKNLLVHVIIVHGIALIIGFAVLFTVKGNQLSRLLMLLFYGISCLFIVVKRIIFHIMANVYVDRHKVAYRTLIIGNGQLAARCFKEINSKSMNRYTYAGYVAERKGTKLPNYMGDYESLANVLQSNGIEQVIIAQDSTDRRQIDEILTCCVLHGVPVNIIPVFNDYISNLRPEISMKGLISFGVRENKTSYILGVNIAVTSIEKAIQKITDNLEHWSGKYICVSNVHTTVLAYEDLSYRKVQNGAVMALPDGGPLSAYSRNNGSSDAQRVTGPDLMKEILNLSGEYGWKHFFYGSKQETLDKLKEVIEERYPGAQIVGMISPPFRELTPEEDERYVREINETNPDFVWVGLGAPKQEVWMAAHEDRVKGLMIGVGAAFDYECGNIKRAPKWMQKMNLEWVYRLLQDPKRLFKRYLSTNIKYMWLTRK